MDHILFLPLNQNHVYIFKEIIAVLDMDYTVLCHDRVSDSKPNHTENMLQNFELNYRHFPERLNRSDRDGIGKKTIHFFKIRNMVRTVLDRLQPRLVVLALDNDPLAQVLISEGHKRGIKSIMVPEGLLKLHQLNRRKRYLSDHAYNLLRKGGLYLNYIRYGSGDCDHICVSGRLSHDILLQLGVPQNRMSVVGQQKYDGFLEKVRQLPKGKSERPVFLYAASTRIFKDEKEIRLLRGVVESAQALKLDVIAKLHPRTPEPTEALTARIGDEFRGTLRVLKEGYDTFYLLQTVDIVVTISSAIVLEALMMDKECIAASYLAGMRRFEYDSYDTIFTIEASQEIFPTMELSITNPKPWPNKKRLLEDELLSLDGKAAERASQKIKEMIDD